MLKRIVSKLKNLFGSKQKPTVALSAKLSSEAKVVPKERKPHSSLRKNEIKPREIPKKEDVEKFPPRAKKQYKSEVQPKEIRKELIVDNWDASEFKIPIEDGKTRFHDFDLVKEILHAIYDLGFKYCTQVQAETLSKSLNGEDVTAQAQTGTGKTAAFLITIFNHLVKNPIDKKRKNGTPRALILAPTRELVLQIEKDARLLGKYLNVSILSLLGGIDYIKQQKSLHSQPTDIIICTPGRLIDFMRKKIVDLSKVEFLIIDEADRMLDMGFIPSVKQIVISTPPKAKRQTMFFSATMTADVKRLAESWTRQAFVITVMPDDIAVQAIEQITYITTLVEKLTLLYNIIIQKNLTRVLIFVNRRDEARRLKDKLQALGISCNLLSGDVEQTQRIKRLESFREGKVRVLIATDVASRGIHVDAISHVINYNLSQDVEEYVHRIGRTGRAGASGISINFADEESSYELQKLEEFLGKKIDCIFPDESLLLPIPEMDILSQKEKITKKVYNKKPDYRPRRKP